MARFRYTAKSMSGKTKRGTVEALTENALVQELKEREKGKYIRQCFWICEKVSVCPMLWRAKSVFRI